MFLLLVRCCKKPSSFAGVYKVSYPPPWEGGGGEFIKSAGEEYSVLKKGSDYSDLLRRI